MQVKVNSAIYREDQSIMRSDHIDDDDDDDESSLYINLIQKGFINQIPITSHEPASAANVSANPPIRCVTTAVFKEK